MIRPHAACSSSSSCSRHPDQYITALAKACKKLPCDCDSLNNQMALLHAHTTTTSLHLDCLQGWPVLQHETSTHAARKLQATPMTKTKRCG